MVPLSCAAQMNRPVTPAAWAEAGAAELLGANRAMTSAENPATTSAEMLISRINREPMRPRNMIGTPRLSREASVRQANPPRDPRQRFRFAATQQAELQQGGAASPRRLGHDRATRRAGREISSSATVSRSQRWRVCSTRWPSAELTILGDARRNPTRHGHKTIVAALFRHQHRYLTANHGNIQRAPERAKMCALLEKAAPHQGDTSGESLCRRWAKDR